MKPGKYGRTSFEVEAEEVSEDNIYEVAKWCGGVVFETSADKYPHGSRLHIKVPVSNAAQTSVPERQTLAFYGDNVVKGSFGPKGAEGWKVYTPKAFKNSFTAIPDPVSAGDEPACGRTEFTLDHKPCVLGNGHFFQKVKTGCRSFGDYMYL